MAAEASMPTVINSDNLSFHVDEGQYNFRPVRHINVTEYKWQFEDVKPLTAAWEPSLQFRIDDRPYPFCPREIELHLFVRYYKDGISNRADGTATSGAKVIPVNNFRYSCIRQILCKVNNSETESASGINLAY